MNFSISVRQPDSARAQADELMVDYIDINIMYDMLKKFPNKKYVIRIPRATEVDWNELSFFRTQGDVVLAIEDLHIVDTCKEKRFKYYWAYPITSYFELRGVLDLGVSEVLLGAPLYFDLMLPALKKVKVRLIANVCYEDYIPRKSGCNGTYVRPEDVSQYEPYVDTLQFMADGLQQERTLMEIYKKGEWPGNLNILLTNLNTDVDNRGIPDEFAQARIQCRQTCMQRGTCHFCDSAIKFPNLIKQHKDQIKKK